MWRNTLMEDATHHISPGNNDSSHRRTVPVNDVIPRLNRVIEYQIFQSIAIFVLHQQGDKTGLLCFEMNGHPDVPPGAFIL
jgi:hypothetical protein